MNIAYIMEPHFNTESFRVAVKNQQNEKTNYIVVCCSPAYNGVWSWDRETTKVNLITNNKLPCFVVPIESCTFLKNLDEINNPMIKEQIVKVQKKYIKSYRKKKQDWCLY